MCMVKQETQFPHTEGPNLSLANYMFRMLSGRGRASLRANQLPASQCPTPFSPTPSVHAWPVISVFITWLSVLSCSLPIYGAEITVRGVNPCLGLIQLQQWHQQSWKQKSMAVILESKEGSCSLPPGCIYKAVNSLS